MNKRSRSYQEELLQSLRDNPQEAIAYLNAALMDEDRRVFLLALRNVLEAQGVSLGELARDADLNRENLYRMLSLKGNPKLQNVRSMLNVMGLELAIQPIPADRR